MVLHVLPLTVLLALHLLPCCRYGMFKQLIKDGYQAEVPDIWLTEGNPWEVKRHDVRFEVGFSGKTATSNGKTTWTPAEKVSRQQTK
jgi:starch phosphorylase